MITQWLKRWLFPNVSTLSHLIPWLKLTSTSWSSVLWSLSVLLLRVRASRLRFRLPMRLWQKISLLTWLRMVRLLARTLRNSSVCPARRLRLSWTATRSSLRRLRVRVRSRLLGLWPSPYTKGREAHASPFYFFKNIWYNILKG